MLEPSTRHAVESSGIEVIIKEARRRRRRRWLIGVLCAVVLVAGTATGVRLRGGGRSAGAVTDGAARRVAATSCASSLTYGPLPEWARAGFQPPDVSMPHVLGARGAIVAVLWSRRDPLVTPPEPGRNNKILWVSRLPLAAGSNLEITTRRLAGATPAGPVERRVVVGGPGPSGIDMPMAGCWQFTLRWSGHRDVVDLPYTARRS
jgi:hypothetical protein